MPRRAPARAEPQDAVSHTQNCANELDLKDPLTLLRTQWKWAAFSQFFFTFNHLFAMNDVSLNMIEDDLVNGTRVVLPRIMQRLLYTLSYDRKVSLNNWQTALRKQYRKRDPAANPIGPEPRVEEEPEEESSSPVPEVPEATTDGPEPPNAIEQEAATAGPSTALDNEKEDIIPESTRASTLERGLSLGISAKGLSVQPSEPESLQPPSFNDEAAEQEESKDWLDLPMLVKLDSMHILTEWQFQNPTRLRTLMRSEDDAASWRIEPIGYDSKRNAYWLIGADRLWIQRPIPKPRRPAKSSTSPLKRKRPTKAAPLSAPSASKSKSISKAIIRVPAAKRPRLQQSMSQAQEASPGTGRARAAKSQAKVKLDAQAKELAALNAQAAREAASLRRGGGSPLKMPLGTRVSARLRGREEDEEWQAVPDEWLHGDGEQEEGEGSGKRGRTKARGLGGVNGSRRSTRGKRKMDEDEEDEDDDEKEGEENEEEDEKDLLKKTGLESDGSEISELTELSEDSGERAEHEDGDQKSNKKEKKADAKVKEEEDLKLATVPSAQVDDRGFEPTPILPEGFIEWETICVTLHDWEHIAERFQKGTHYTEKALYRVLVKDLVPVITEELRELERKERLATALTLRKRSSRLLLRQSEKEEAEAAARKIAEEAERTSRARRQEVRARKDEEERERRETAREMRRREREEREERERIAALENEGKTAGSDMQIDVVGNGLAVDGVPVVDNEPAKRKAVPPGHVGNGNGGSNGVAKTGTGSGSRTPVGEEWELDCEICHRRGINLDDGTPMMSCGLCSKWQHIACHDRADQQAGRPRRNWDVVEFFCLQCRAKRAVASGSRGASGGPRPPQAQTMGVGRGGQNPYMPHSMTEMGSYNRNEAAYMALGVQARYPAPISVNGSGSSYASAHDTSSARPHLTTPQQQQQPIPRHGQQQSQLPPQQQPYGTPISFSHYQPQHRGFSSSAHTQQQQPYGSHTTPYGHQYAPYSVANGGEQVYQQPSQPRWNAASPVTSNAGAGGVNVNVATGGASVRPGHPLSGPPPQHPHLDSQQWQQTQPQAQNVPPPSTQFRYHASSFQPAPS